MNGILELDILLNNISYQWYDLVGNIGVFFILITYLLLQLDKIDSHTMKYSCLNAVGASAILCSLYFEFNLSAFIIELFWLLISLIGIIKFFLMKLSFKKNPKS